MLLIFLKVKVRVENADEGIISFVISTTTEQSHAVCLNIIAKNSVPENAETAIKGTDYFTNINSNYFPVIVTTKTISGIQVESTNSTVSSIYYNKEASKIDYKAGVALKARFVDGGNATLDPENVDLSNLVTSYEFDKDRLILMLRLSWMAMEVTNWKMVYCL